MTPRELADYLESISQPMTRGRFLLASGQVISETIATLRSQADEIDALKAAAIVADTIKLAEWEKWAKRLEDIKAALISISSSVEADQR